MELVQKICGSIGRKFFEVTQAVKDIFGLAMETFYQILISPFKGKRIRWASTIEQMVLIGYNSIPIVTLILFFVGLIMAMQSAYQLQQFGATIYVANLVAVSICRELSPLLTAIIVTGRSGSAITAEIGTMKVSEEIDALTIMGLNPVNFLVVPRTIAMLIMVPALTLIGDFVGIMGGYVISMATLDFTSIRYINQTIDAIVFKDVASGLVKSFFFGLIIAKIGSYQGFKVRGGAEGVGKSTTQSVVTSIFLIIAADVIFTAIFFSNL